MQQSVHISQTPVELVAADGWFPELTPLGDASVKVHTRALIFTCSSHSEGCLTTKQSLIAIGGVGGGDGSGEVGGGDGTGGVGSGGDWWERCDMCIVIANWQAARSHNDTDTPLCVQT